ncbi:ligase-associated DNA damage response DEXH box helicase [Caldimonas thermodepolymerans]|uniref:ATP-dependent Lhr-like helicase n=1 Tax=Caldimonas thermodepolymerans TaxID=215580 RepID=A0A2S5T8S8_9BURK|nr:ligase-associated DNA damage response DEXH box helicase [Caldimonas thermodepolymerans]PPE71391.1 DNA ligase-associated DEXH box helicase [Caldimonas thermodepolymerans]QPC32566.1 ligase-associated DNA damage response DEXH box helicase [Caldimonas thermodepolymerans]RDH98964.1 ATP-dependent Lhr-like helicase [Caldimonas thermodepolymerans]TCP06363.1 ATP-dependent Lhr-like helicase [Caldimonas thermodepolymerans]UZG49120.1 ligase-associated DNA damage response DEXH box helicase [Caldimonas t
MDEPITVAEDWFASRGWQPFPFQREVWQAMQRGASGLLHATTGAGKTYAVWLGALLRARRHPAAARGAPPLQVLWITPMRALAADSVRALQAPLAALAPGWSVGMRTGDTPAAERARQDRRWPAALVTTPESLSLMLTRESAREQLAQVHTVIVDEWHELLGNKRGVQVQLALARLRRWNPSLAVWGLSATLGNLGQAMEVLLGGPGGTLVQGRIDKALVIDTLIPPEPGRFTWAGHLGQQMQQPVIDEIERSSTTLVFTNTRSQAELWYQMLIEARPDWAGLVALHHGSLDQAAREWVELGLKEGRLKAVVATSSLDLGVDFLPVERVLQIGSARGVARLLQRAGRSGHAPGRPSRVTLVPTHTMELVEAVAARRAAQAGRIEQRVSPDKPLDVLVQHLVTVALGGGFTSDDLYDEVRSAYAYRGLTRQEWRWALNFVERGGDSLHAYPEYHRVRPVDGVYRVTDRGIARRHRLQVGTIVGDATMQVKYLGGSRIGTIEESFIARLKPGDCFLFGGRLLEFVRVQDLVAYVRRAERRRGAVPRWNGGRMSLSNELADMMLQVLRGVQQGDVLDGELQAAQPMLAVQQRLSRLPSPETLLVERYRSREGHHLYLYPFAGRDVHMGLASLLAWRLAKDRPNTFSLSFNDYGLELLSALPVDVSAVLDGRAFSSGHLLEDVLASLNSTELSQRRFREIARVAGLVFAGYPGAPKSMKQLQASSSLFFEVFRKYDPGNLLLAQAEREVLSQELDIARLRATLGAMRRKRIEAVVLRHPSPMSLPLMVERFREQLTTEKLADRLQRILRAAEKTLQKTP